jgi:hypothetical protein
MRLETDLRMLFLMLNEARYRTLQAALGVSRPEANLVSLVLLGMTAHSAGRRWRRLMSGPAPLPSSGDTALGVAGMREVIQSIAGPASRDTSMLGTLLAVAAAGGIILPIVGRSARAVEQGIEETTAAFRRRYGVHAARAAKKVSQLNLGGADR